jgi:hypothetical protein
MNVPSDGTARPPLCRVGFFIELPFDARLPPHHASNTIGLRDPPIEGWDDLDLQRYLGFPPIDAEGVHPTTTLYFRRRTYRRDPPLNPEIGAFGREFYDLLGVRRGRRLWNRLKPGVLRMRHAFPESRTVVLGQRVNSTPTYPPPNSWMEREFETILDTLNNNLFALSWVSGDTSIGPVLQSELPPILFGFMLDMRELLPRRGRLSRLVRPVRPGTFMFMNPSPRQIEPEVLAPDVIEGAQAVTQAQEHEPPFMPSAEILHAAEQALVGGRFRQAVLEAGTAIELLVNTAIREAGPVRGDRPETVQGALNTAFANRVRDHFARIVGFDQNPDESDDALGEWWRAGYALRNRVAHDGHLPTVEQATEAFVTAQVLSNAVGEAFYGDPVIRERMELFRELFPALRPRLAH